LTWHWRPAVLAASGALQRAAVDRLVLVGELVGLGTYRAGRPLPQGGGGVGPQGARPSGTQAGEMTLLGRLGFGALAGSSARRTDSEPAGDLVGGVEPGFGGDHLVAPGPVISA
jgi:hypothetical protein